MRRSGDIRARAAGNGVVVGEVRKTTTVSLSTQMNSAEIGLAVFEKRLYGRTHKQTDRHLLYTHID